MQSSGYKFYLRSITNTNHKFSRH